jgi:hypothetical protein
MDVIYLFEEGKTRPFLGFTKQQTTKFEGQCYKCGCYKHTQRFCPLQQCELCTSFGHHERVCRYSSQNKTFIKKKNNQCVFQLGY